MECGLEMPLRDANGEAIPSCDAAVGILTKALSAM